MLYRITFSLWGDKVLDCIEFYNAVDRIRQIIYIFNDNYMRQNLGINSDRLLSYIQKVCVMGMRYTTYWKGTDVDFQMLYTYAEEIEKAAEANDFVYIHDKLNCELWQMIKSILKTLFDKNGNILSGYFEKQNREALKKRFPQILEQLDKISDTEQCEYIRSYGLRGKVVYRKMGETEIDLYSAYDAAGLKIMRSIEYGKYDKIYVWGCNGGVEINEIVLLSEHAHLKSEIYVLDLKEFRHIIQNTIRTGVLLDSRIDWRFNANEQEFVNSFDLKKKETAYIYICGDRARITVLEDFIYKNSLNSNI